MLDGYDFLLIALSMLVASLSLHYSCKFLKRIDIATPTQKNTLLPIYSCTIGAILFGINNLNWVAMHPISGDTLSIPLLLGSMFAAMFATYNVFSGATEKRISISEFINRAIVAGLSCYAMFYLSFASRHAAETINVNIELLFLAFLAATLVCMLTILYYFKMKLAAQNNANNTVNVTLALVVGALITGLYAIFNTTLSIEAHIPIGSERLANNRETIASIISISIASLFALSFIAPKCCEKLYQSLKQLSSKFSVNDDHANDLITKDALTQLANRRGFEAQLNAAVKRSTRMGKTIALAYIDLDHFKPINDNYGHHIGDAVLVAVAQRLNKTVRACDFVARLGGDEFVAIIEDITFDEDITPIIGRVVDSIKESFHVENQHIHISCSVGVAVYPGDGDIEKLIVCADAAMYKAKENGKNQFKFFDAEIELASEQMVAMHHDLRQAIDNNEFVLMFQPKVDCKTQQPVGAEALIRWNHPSKGLLQPDEFLPAAERFGLVNYINAWVLEEACRTIYRAKIAGVALNISINLARQQFRNPNLVLDIVNVIENYDIPANSIMFEIKETTAIKNEAQFISLLQNFKDANIKIALDDFGSHNFSLSYLQNLNVDEVKLDKVFIAAINESKASHALVDAVVRLAHALDLNVVAEGVETEAQRRALAEMGCDHMQGYLFSKAVTEDKITDLFKQLSINFESTGEFLLTDYQSHANNKATTFTMAAQATI